MKSLKIAFVEPALGFRPFSALGTYPLGMLYNATALKRARPEDEIICFDEDSKRIFKNGTITEPALFGADVIGIGMRTATAPRAYQIADKLRDLRARGKTNPNLQIIIGGIHATHLPQEAMEHADCVVRYEGENVIEKVVAEKMKGIVKGGVVENLDSLADPDYSLLAYKKRKLTDLMYGNLASVNTSRGCSYACDFCSVWATFGRNVRIESPEKTVDKLENLNKQGFRRFFIHDDNFSDLGVRPYREAFFDLVAERKLKMRYTVQDRIDLLQDKDYVEKMARSGCGMVMFALESPNEDFLKSHNKQLDLGKVGNGVDLLRRNKINPYAFCMVEPENPEAAKGTVKLLRDLGVRYAQFTIPTPLPGSILYQKLKGRIKQKWDYFDGLTLVTETGDKVHEAAEHLSETWKKFYSPMRAAADVFKFRYTDAILRLYGWNIGRRIPRVQPRF